MVKLTKAITHSVGADLSFLDFPKLCSNSAVRGHSIREPSHPNGNQPSVVMRSAKRWKTDRTASQMPTRRAWADRASPHKSR